MTTLQETILGGIIAGLIVAAIVYIGSQIDKYYIQRKIESTNNFWLYFWLLFLEFLVYVVVASHTIYYYLYKPFDKEFVLTVAIDVGLIVFFALNSIHNRQVIKSRKRVNELVKDTVTEEVINTLIKIKRAKKPPEE